MATPTELAVNLILLGTAGALIWLLLRLRQRRRVKEGGIDDHYSGAAKNPEILMEPDEDALEDLEDLLQQARNKHDGE
ncbi:MAG: hypothetical protein VX571_02465 [Candidatus Thermoplasmatota archaeon]|nr:hypothetical protein [Candidatus Thermoplasmatota archaeon]